MSKLTYTGARDRPLVWLHGQVKTPPFSPSARIETGIRLRQLQRGQRLGMPHSRPMPSIGRRCHELRVTDGNTEWRLAHRIDDDAIVIAEVFAKRSVKTPTEIIATCKQRLRRYDDAQAKAQSSGI